MLIKIWLLHMGWLEGTLDGILGTPTALNGNKNYIYDIFRAFPWLHHKIINGWFDGILEYFIWCDEPGMQYKSGGTP